MNEATRKHRVHRVRESVPGDPDHPEPPLSPRKVCADCGRLVTHLGRMRNGSPWVHGNLTAALIEKRSGAES